MQDPREKRFSGELPTGSPSEFPKTSLHRRSIHRVGPLRPQRGQGLARVPGGPSHAPPLPPCPLPLTGLTWASGAFSSHSSCAFLLTPRAVLTRHPFPLCPSSPPPVPGECCPAVSPGETALPVLAIGPSAGFKREARATRSCGLAVSFRPVRLLCPQNFPVVPHHPTRPTVGRPACQGSPPCGQTPAISYTHLFPLFCALISWPQEPSVHSSAVQVPWSLPRSLWAPCGVLPASAAHCLAGTAVPSTAHMAGDPAGPCRGVGFLWHCGRVVASCGTKLHNRPRTHSFGGLIPHTWVQMAPRSQ
ncbi:uncharacterized protein C10orf143 homolog isoform X1 [Echinops telfairi]|uniref:Uncharacterized protein C10orf143 homolog isoform X1 n=2 Tax=Echinops telfairi TaxID=9371 RepID=A0AC55D6R1_ECHTE|nr:uncharacterized protein C10orf143 homolog isoform X1 [Echinops telfairi]XP_045147432.1 uncharacterized protein C10orf143 homolog isoform X1 [Echinops telfairi]